MDALDFSAGRMDAGSSRRPFTWHRCLILCLPALLIGTCLRVTFLSSIPEGFYGADSGSYFQPTVDLWTKSRISFQEKRRWLYQFFLLPLPAMPVSPARTVPILQHLAGLATIFGIGWVVGNLTRLRELWVPAVTILAAVWPKMLWSEHEVIAEALLLGAFVLTAALGSPPGALMNRRRLFWYLIAAAMVVAFKPHGRGIWLGCILAAALITRNPLRWDWKCWAAIAGGVVIILTSGSTRQGNWLMLNSTLPLVNLEAPKWKEYREALKPVVLKTRGELDQYAWTQGEYKKPLISSDPAKIGPVWAELTGDDKFSQVCGDLAKGGILEHPVTFTQFMFTKIGISFATGAHTHRFAPKAFWEKQGEINRENWQRSRSDPKVFYRMDQAGTEQLANERKARKNWLEPFTEFIQRKFVFVYDNEDPLTHKHWLSPGWMGLLAFFGLLVCLMPRRFTATSILWLPAILCLVTVFAIGDRHAQYVQPVEWVLMVWMAIGLDVILMALYALLCRAHRKTAAPA